MVKLFDRGARFLAAKLPAVAGVAVTYRRGAASVGVPDAVAGGEDARTAQPGPSPAFDARTDRDYLIPAASLVLGGSRVDPAPGDVVEETIGGAVCRYRVDPRGGGPCWRWSDPAQTVYRVSTRRA